MEGKRLRSSPPPPAPPSSSLASDLFGTKDPPNHSPSLFQSVLPTATAVKGWDSSRSDIIRHSEKSEAQNQTQDAKSVAAGGKSEGDAQRDKNAAYQEERIYPCSLSSSLYYGGQDIYISPSNLHKFDEDYKPDGDDDSTDPDLNAASRGNWWQGSLYY